MHMNIDNNKLIEMLHFIEVEVDDIVDKATEEEIRNNGMKIIINKVIKLLSYAHLVTK